MAFDVEESFEQSYDLTRNPHTQMTIELDVITVIINPEASRSELNVTVAIDGYVLWTWQPADTSAAHHSAEAQACTAEGKAVYRHPDLIQHVRLRLDHTASHAALRVVVRGRYAVDNVHIGLCHTMVGGPPLCWDSDLETFDGAPACVVCSPGRFIDATSRSCVACPPDTFGTEGGSCTPVK